MTLFEDTAIKASDRINNGMRVLDSGSHHILDVRVFVQEMQPPKASGVMDGFQEVFDSTGPVGEVLTPKCFQIHESRVARL